MMDEIESWNGEPVSRLMRACHTSSRADQSLDWPTQKTSCLIVHLSARSTEKLDNFQFAWVSIEIILSIGNSKLHKFSNL